MVRRKNAERADQHGRGHRGASALTCQRNKPKAGKGGRAHLWLAESDDAEGQEPSRAKRCEAVRYPSESLGMSTGIVAVAAEVL